VTVAASIPPLRPLTSHLDDPFFDGTKDPTRTGAHHHDVVAPRFDVEEADDAYFLQGEFPGVADKNEITLERCGPRTLAVMAHVPKFDLRTEWVAATQQGAAHGNHKHLDEAEVQAGWDSISPAVQANQLEEPVHLPGTEDHGADAKQPPSSSRMLCRLSERHAGKMQRSFTFPTAVHFEGLKANFGHGLLKIVLPKSKEEDSESHRILIDDW